MKTYMHLKGWTSAFILILICLSAYPSAAVVIERIVAYVNDTAITFSEFTEQYSRARNKINTITKQEVIDSIINRILLLKEAQRIKLEAPSENALLHDYIEIKIKAHVIIKDETIREFYEQHIGDFKGKDFITVRDQIESYLFEYETNRLLKNHIEDLRNAAEIRIQLQDQQ